MTRTLEMLVNPEPVNVSTRLALGAVCRSVDVGLTLVRDGTGALWRMVNALLAERPPPGAGLETVTMALAVVVARSRAGMVARSVVPLT